MEAKMFDPIPLIHLRWMDHLRLEYWRQVIRLTRLARQFKAWLIPVQHLLWVPLIAGLAGLLLGFIVTVV
jgi:hypothetical protein